MICFIDCETIPGDADWVKQTVADWAEFQHPPANLCTPEPKSYKGEKLQAWKDKRADDIAAWHEHVLPEMIHQERHKQCLKAETGEIITICCKIDEYETATFSTAEFSEASMIEAFFVFIEDAKQSSKRAVTFCGHNVLGFDINYIWQRAKILGVGVPLWYPSPASLKPWSEDVFDTMIQYAGPRGTIKLDTLCKAFGIPGKDGIDGSMVWQMYLDGRQDEIDEYCKDDVSKVAALYKRLA